MATYSASVTLPFDDLPRATAALRGWLRLQAADSAEHPDWETMSVTASGTDQDEFGRAWFCWSATVSSIVAPTSVTELLADDRRR